jgi:hypothetical protein
MILIATAAFVVAGSLIADAVNVFITRSALEAEQFLGGVESAPQILESPSPAQDKRHRNEN